MPEPIIEQSAGGAAPKKPSLVKALARKNSFRRDGERLEGDRRVATSLDLGVGFAIAKGLDVFHAAAAFGQAALGAKHVAGAVGRGPAGLDARPHVPVRDLIAGTEDHLSPVADFDPDSKHWVRNLRKHFGLC